MQPQAEAVRGIRHCAIADNHDLEERSVVAVVQDAKAVTQIRWFTLAYYHLLLACTNKPSDPFMNKLNIPIRKQSYLATFAFPVSLRTSFAIGLGAVFLSFFVTAVVSQIYLLPRLVDPLNKSVLVFTDELEPVNHLQKFLLKAAMPVNDYLIRGDPNERLAFKQFRDILDQSFHNSLSPRYTNEDVRATILFARAQWEQARALGELLLQITNPVGNAPAARDMERFDAHIEQAVDALERTHEYFHQILDQNRTQSDAIYYRALWVNVIALSIAAAAALLAAILLRRSITVPLGALLSGTAQLAEGNLSHRVILHRNDELGELAVDFNKMAVQLETAQEDLIRIATHDGLTGLYNHRTFYALLSDELSRSMRFKRVFSLLLIDIDHFKRVNDVHGHLAGDSVLRQLSKLLGSEARAIDRVCRYGGEEICILMPEADLEAATKFAERLRMAVAEKSFELDGGNSITLTVSIGVATWPTHADNAHALVAAADRAMYLAKDGGRNKVVRYEPA